MHISPKKKMMFLPLSRLETHTQGKRLYRKRWCRPDWSLLSPYEQKQSNEPPWITPNLKGIRLCQYGACTRETTNVSSQNYLRNSVMIQLRDREISRNVRNVSNQNGNSAVTGHRTSPSSSEIRTRNTNLIRNIYKVFSLSVTLLTT